MTEVQVFAYVFPAVTIFMTVISTLHWYVEKPAELKDKLSRVRLEALEKNTKSNIAMANYILAQVDTAHPYRNWRGDGATETDYMYLFSKHATDTAIKLIKLERLKKATDIYVVLSLVTILLTIVNAIFFVPANSIDAARWTSSILLMISVTIFWRYLEHCNKVSDIE